MFCTYICVFSKSYDSVVMVSVYLLQDYTSWLDLARGYICDINFSIQPLSRYNSGTRHREGTGHTTGSTAGGPCRAACGLFPKAFLKYIQANWRKHDVCSVPIWKMNMMFSALCVLCVLVCRYHVIDICTKQGCSPLMQRISVVNLHLTPSI